MVTRQNLLPSPNHPNREIRDIRPYIQGSCHIQYRENVQIPILSQRIVSSCESISISIPSATPSSAPSSTGQPAAGPGLPSVWISARRHSYAVSGVLSTAGSAGQPGWRRQRRFIRRRQGRTDARRAPGLRQSNGRDRWHTGHSRQDPEADVNGATDYPDARTASQEKSWCGG